MVEQASDGDTSVGYYRYVESPIGQLLLAATDAGLIRVGFEKETQALGLVEAQVADLRQAGDVGPYSNEPTTALAILDNAAHELAEYFAGRRREFTVPLDLRLGGFYGEVVRELGRIGYGERRSYKEVALSVNNPDATRAVGAACGSNPLPIFLPCHRVVRSDGTWGNYRGGRDVKTYLLRMEED